MLQNLREKMQGIIAWTIVGLICITFALWGIQSYLHSRSDTDSMAKVNGTKITQRQLRSAYERFRRKQSVASGKLFTPDQKTQASIKKDLLQQLIKTTVIMQGAAKAGFYVGDAQLNAVITSLPMFQEQGSFSPAKYQETLNALMYSEQDFRDELRRTLILKQLQFGVVNSDFVLANELSTAVQLLNQKRDFRYVIIPAELFTGGQITQKEISDYYNKNSAAFLAPEQVSISYLKLSASSLKNKIKVTDADLMKFYREHIGLYKNQKFLQVKDKVRQDFVRRQEMQLFADKNDKLTDIVYTSSDSLQPAAAALNLKIQNTELFTRQGGKSEITKNTKIINAAFSDDVLRQGYNSSPVQIGDGTVVVLRVNKHIPEKILPLNEVRSQVLAKIRTHSQQQQAQKVAASILQTLQTNKQRSNVADVNVQFKKYNLHWQKAIKASSKEAKINNKILSKVFDLPMQQGANSISLVQLNDADYAVVQVSKVYPGDIKRLSVKEQDGLKQNLANLFGIYSYNLWVDGLMQVAKIEVLHET